jgi:sec-independent protein translocase protein TatC
MTDIGRYLDFVLTMFIAFGITFEVPIFVVILVRMGIVSIDKLKDIRRYVLVGAFVAGAIFTPPDVVSQFMLAVPLYLLYELGILAAGLIAKPASELAYQPAQPTQPMSGNGMKHGGQMADEEEINR